MPPGLPGTVQRMPAQPGRCPAKLFTRLAHLRPTSCFSITMQFKTAVSFAHPRAAVFPDMVQAVPYWVDDESGEPPGCKAHLKFGTCKAAAAPACNSSSRFQTPTRAAVSTRCQPKPLHPTRPLVCTAQSLSLCTLLCSARFNADVGATSTCSSQHCSAMHKHALPYLTLPSSASFHAHVGARAARGGPRRTGPARGHPQQAPQVSAVPAGCLSRRLAVVSACPEACAWKG